MASQKTKLIPCCIVLGDVICQVLYNRRDIAYGFVSGAKKEIYLDTTHARRDTAPFLFVDITQSYLHKLIFLPLGTH